MLVTLPSGKTIALPVCHPVFSRWRGNTQSFDYGGKPLLNHAGEACFAELVVLRLLLAAGWNGVWVETYGGIHYLSAMPQSWKVREGSIEIPDDKRELLANIWKTGATTACFDVLAWDGDQLYFFEAKHAGKDKLTLAQLKFIQGALACGVPFDHLVIAEWRLAD